MPNNPLSRLLYVSKALASRARLRILGALEGRELCVGQVAAVFDIARSTASEHLSELRRVGLIGERRDGRFVWYSLETDDRARSFLAVVLSELASDHAVRADREMTARILALPHDLICEQGRAALESSTSPAVPAVDPDSPCGSTPNSTADPQEVP